MLFSQQRLSASVIDLFKGFKYVFLGSSVKNIKKHLPIKKNYYFLASAREGLYQIIENISKFDGFSRNSLRVGISAYSCCVVDKSVKRANCSILYYDGGVVADYEDILKIIDKLDVLVLSYNFGFVCDVKKIRKLCSQKGVILVEDCAQTYGMKCFLDESEDLVGTLGDYSVFSFGISKNIGFTGGVICSNKELEIKNVSKYPFLNIFKIGFEVLISSIFFNKFFYSFFVRLLNKKLVQKPKKMNYSLNKYVLGVVESISKRYNQIFSIRFRNYKYLSKYLSGQINFVKDVFGSSYLYFVILIDDVFLKKKFVKMLLDEGVEIGEMKSFVCFDDNFVKAREIEKKVLTFSLYRPFSEVKFIAQKIKKVSMKLGLSDLMGKK